MQDPREGIRPLIRITNLTTSISIWFEIFELNRRTHKIEGWSQKFEMAALDVVVTIILVIVLIVILVVVIIIVGIRERRADQRASDERRLIDDEIGNNGSTNGNGNSNGTNTVIKEVCKKSCGCPCESKCAHDKKTPCYKKCGCPCDLKICKHDRVSDDSSKSSSSDSPCREKCGCPCGNCRCQKPCKVPVPPQLNCIQYNNGQFEELCGPEIANERLTGRHFIQWLPVSGCEVTKYTIYVKAGQGLVTTTNFDFIYYVNESTHFYLTPAIGNGCFSFIVTASNDCGESIPSDIFNSGCQVV